MLNKYTNDEFIVYRVLSPGTNIYEQTTTQSRDVFFQVSMTQLSSEYLTQMTRSLLSVKSFLIINRNLNHRRYHTKLPGSLRFGHDAVFL